MRKLTLREKVLLVLLAVVAVICGYVFLFHLPMEERTDRLNAQIQESRDLLAQTQAMVDRQQEMEAELEELRAGDLPPMPDYDNLQGVMVELNDILEGSLEYALRFSSAQAEGSVMARRVDLPFTCASYTSARSILQRLHDSALRCQLEDLTLIRNEDGTVQVDAGVVFYEYGGGDGE